MHIPPLKHTVSSPVSNLSVKILQHIFICLRNLVAFNTSKALRRCLLVCTKWYNSAYPVIWQDSSTIMSPRSPRELRERLILWLHGLNDSDVKNYTRYIETFVFSCEWSNGPQKCMDIFIKNKWLLKQMIILRRVTLVLPFPQNFDSSYSLIQHCINITRFIKFISMTETIQKASILFERRGNSAFSQAQIGGMDVMLAKAVDILSREGIQIHELSVLEHSPLVLRDACQDIIGLKKLKVNYTTLSPLADILKYLPSLESLELVFAQTGAFDLYGRPCLTDIGFNLQKLLLKATELSQEFLQWLQQLPLLTTLVFDTCNYSCAFEPNLDGFDRLQNFEIVGDTLPSFLLIEKIVKCAQSLCSFNLHSAQNFWLEDVLHIVQSATTLQTLRILNNNKLNATNLFPVGSLSLLQALRLLEECQLPMIELEFLPVYEFALACSRLDVLKLTSCCFHKEYEKMLVLKMENQFTPVLKRCLSYQGKTLAFDLNQLRFLAMNLDNLIWNDVFDRHTEQNVARVEEEDDLLFV